MYRANVEGTRAILDAAQKNRVRRVVYTSSVATMGFTSNRQLADEDSPVSLEDMIGPYKRSKFMAEQVAIEAARSGQDVVIVNPTTPIGERDIKPTPTGRIVLDFLKKKFPAYVDTGLNLVDVKACALGHIAAFEKGRSGGALHPRRRKLDAKADSRQARLRSRVFPPLRFVCHISWRSRPVLWMKYLRGASVAASRARPLTPSAWGARKCS